MGTRRPHLAMIAAALVAGAFEAAHGLAWEGRVHAGPLAVMVASVLVELEALTAVFRHGVARRRSVAWSFALSSVLAIGLGVASSCSVWWIQRTLGVLLLGGMSAMRLSIAVQLGAFDGLVALGLWALAILIPFAVPRALEAEQLRAAAELARLRANLQPHFLLNTLNTVAGLASEDPREARNLIGALGDLLRDSLADGGEMQTIDDEIAWLKRYAEILEIRHRGSLVFHWDIAEATRDVRIPRLLLQPLLENAVKHGALRRRDGGEVSIRATLDRSAARVTCVIEDNGPGPSASGPREGARGLALVTRRLELEYVGAAAFRLEAERGRTRSIVELPIGAA